MINAIGNSGARSSGPIGCRVPGWSGAGGGFGRSAAMLYQCLGIWVSSRVYFTLSLMTLLLNFIVIREPGALAARGIRWLMLLHYRVLPDGHSAGASGDLYGSSRSQPIKPCIDSRLRMRGASAPSTMTSAARGREL